MTNPLVTIGLTTFNAEDTVARAVESALAQTWQPVEIIVVDDVSTDRTVDIVREIAAPRGNIEVLVNSRNSGPATGRNRIIERARGDFIALFDDDDISRPDRIDRQVSRLVAYERRFAGGAPAVCHAAREQLYPDGTQRIERTIGEVEDRAAPSGPAVARRVLMGTPMRDGFGSCATCSQMARTEVYRVLGGFDSSFRRIDDTDFCVRLARAGGHFPGIAEPLVVQTMTQAPDKRLAREETEFLALLEKHRDLIGDDATYRFCREWTRLKYDWLGGKRAAFAGSLLRLAVGHPAATFQRLRFALPGLATNRAFRNLHKAYEA